MSFFPIIPLVPAGQGRQNEVSVHTEQDKKVKIFVSLCSSTDPGNLIHHINSFVMSTEQYLHELSGPKEMELFHYALWRPLIESWASLWKETENDTITHDKVQEMLKKLVTEYATTETIRPWAYVNFTPIW